MDAFRSISPSILNRSLLAFAISLTLAACGSQGSNGDEGGNSDSVTNPVNDDTGSDSDSSVSDNPGSDDSSSDDSSSDDSSSDDSSSDDSSSDDSSSDDSSSDDSSSDDSSSDDSSSDDSSSDDSSSDDSSSDDSSSDDSSSDDSSSDDSNSDDSSSDVETPAISANTCNASSGSRCFYAAPQGTGDGSANNPGSLTALLPQLHAGDTLYLTEGVYQQYSSNDADAFILSLNKYFRFASEPSVEKPIRIQGYPGHNAIIRGDDERRCILVDGQSHLEFRDLTVENCFNEGMRIGWDVPEENITLDGMTFRQIRYHDNSGFVYIQSYKNVIIENSTFHDYLPKSNGQTGYYLKMFQAIDTTVRHNHFYGEGGGMYYKHGESQTGRGGYTRIYNNHFDQLSKQGVYTNQNRSEIYDNLFTNNGGIAVHQEDGTRPPFTQDVHIHHNTLVNSAIVLNQGSNDGNYFDAFGLGAKYAKVHNNLIKNSAYHIWVYGSNQQYDEGIHLTSYDNCFDNSNGDFLIDYFSSDTFGNKGAKMSLSQWQAAGYDNQSLEQTLILDNEYRLPAGSPCATTGRRQ